MTHRVTGALTMRVVLVRPWRDSAAAGGCCSAGPDAVRLERAGSGNGNGVTSGERAEPHRHADVLAQVYRALREFLPGVDVQVVASGNTLFLVPAAYLAARARHGRLSALRHAIRSTTAGAVLMDGELLGHVEQLGPHGVVAAVRERTRTLDSGRRIP